MTSLLHINLWLTHMGACVCVCWGVELYIRVNVTAVLLAVQQL